MKTKKLLVLALSIIILSSSLLGCNEPITFSTDTVESVTETESETVETTAPEVPKEPPFFDTSKFQNIEAPAVIDEISFEQLEVFEGYDYEFLHEITTPKIDSTLPGAVALNEKMSENEYKIVNELTTKTENSRFLYKVHYTHSSFDGVIAIQKLKYTGLFASEGADSAEYYYYDSVNDRELSSEEYLAHFGLDADDLNFRARWNVGYVYEEAHYDGLYYSDTLLNKDESTYRTELSDTGVNYAVAKEAITPMGFEVTEDNIAVYYLVRGYVPYNSVCKISNATGLPDNPLFFIKCQKTGVLEGQSGVKIDFENGLPSRVLVSDDIPLTRDLIISNKRLKAIYSLDYQGENFAIRASDSYVKVNGNGESGHGYNQALIEDDNGNMFMQTYYYPEQLGLEDFETIEIIFETDKPISE